MDWSIAEPAGDYSGAFGKVRPRIVNSRNEKLIDYVKTLSPRYAIVYRDIALGYGFLFGTLAAMAFTERAGAPKLLVLLIGSISVGYWIAYLQLFIHEGAHWNLAADREKSDRLCNLLITWLAGQEVKAYRQIHFPHHRLIGTVDDTEHTYFFPLNLIFIAKSLLGIRALEVMRSRNQFADQAAQKRREPIERPEGPRIHAPLVFGLLFHLLIVASMLYAGLWATALAWGAGVAAFFPFFGALRQLLEHRPFEASAKIEMSAVARGPTSRIFGDGVLASTFGGAGFNRHLIHHWEPTVSYTRLRDLEDFLRDTDLKTIIERRSTTYGRAFWILFGR
ncbi:MAG TPA: fatty acid desaturase [Roseiarcus sp.]|nr:fatty acid desaturase [Roseiarcus sp.]